MYLPNTWIKTNFSVFCCVGLFCPPDIAAADRGPAWGLVSNGLTIAVEGRTTPEDGRLHVLFRNTGVGDIRFAVGGRIGAGAIYDLDFVTAEPNARTCKVYDLTVAGVGGYISPIVIFLMPGATEQVSIDLRNLRCIADDRLLKEGDSVRATLNVTAESNAWANVRNGWTGSVTSGSFTIRNSGGL